jgi:hypothetical protein
MSSPQYYNSSDNIYIRNAFIGGNLDINGTLEATTIAVDNLTELNQGYIALTGNLVLNQPDSFLLVDGNIFGGNLNIKSNGSVNCGELNCLGTVRYGFLDPPIPLSPYIIQKASGSTSPIRFLRIGGGSLFNFTNYYEFEINLNFRMTNVFSTSYNLSLALSIDNGSTYFQDSVELVSHEMNVGSGSFSVFQRFNSSFNYGGGFDLLGPIAPDWNGNLRLKFRDPVGSRSSASYEAYFQKSGVGIAMTSGTFGLNNTNPINMLQFSFPTGFIEYSYNVIAYPR